MNSLCRHPPQTHLPRQMQQPEHLITYLIIWIALSMPEIRLAPTAPSKDNYQITLKRLYERLKKAQLKH